MLQQAFRTCGPAPRHRVPCGALRNFGNDERGRRECDSDSCPRISSGRSIEKFQMGNVAAYLGLAPAARRIMRQQKSSRAHEPRRGARARDGSRYLCTGNSARTTPAGWPTHGRRARRPFFLLQFFSIGMCIKSASTSRLKFE